jgi:RHS repeat-associated protein
MFNRLYQLTAYAAATPIDQIVYNYYTAGNPREGLLQSINNDGPPPLATYSYDTSGLVQTIALENNITTTWTRDAAYQTTSYLTNNTSNTTVSGVTHGYDDASRRKYAQYEDNLGQAYSYDDAGQVTNAKVNIANPATTSATTSPTHSYDYDAVGNRNSSLAFGTTTNYTANNVNAYTAITGSANPIYDDNGNMTSGPVPAGAATLNYDKENRLRSSVCNGVTTYYTYDALSRLLSVDQPNSNGAPTKEIFTWSSWTMLARAIYTSGSLTETLRYTWGLDLSGSLEGAGGVGGLLAIERNVTGNNTWDIRYAHNDANGNIIALTDSSGTVSARYRYDAFGNTLSATDVDNTGWVNHNLHRFSSKPAIGTTGLLFYGYRWYTPRDARWINKDPIEEKGGRNLYGFVGNDGVGKWDVLGLILNFDISKCSCRSEIEIDAEKKKFTDALDKLSKTGPLGKAMADLVKSPNYTLNIRLCFNGGPTGGNVSDEEGSVGLPIDKDRSWVSEDNLNQAIEHGDSHKEDSDKLDEIIIGHELGHAIFGFDDPGVVDAVENVIREELQKKPRKVYTGYDDILPSEDEKINAQRIIDKFKSDFPGLEKILKTFNK